LQSLFTKCLSQRIRHLRHDDKRKSGTVTKYKHQASVCFKPATVSTAEQPMSPEDTQRNLAELQKEWSKNCQSRNATHINIILDQTHNHLLKLLKEDETGRIAPVLAVYPCLEEGRHVSILFLFVSKMFSVQFSSKR